MTIREEIKSGKYELPYSKAGDPATYKQIKFLCSLDAVKEISVSTSQMMKRMPKQDASELIEAAKEGIEFSITE